MLESNPNANRIGLRTTLGSGGSGAGEPRGNHKSSCGKPWQPKNPTGDIRDGLWHGVYHIIRPSWGRKSHHFW